MMSKALIPIFLAALVYVSAQNDTTSSPTTSTAAPTSSSSASTESSSTSTTAAPTASTPTINNCTRPGRYPATSGKCIQEYIVCIPNFKGGFWQHKWKCAGSLVYNDRFKKCTSPRKADCNNTSTTSTTTTTSSTTTSTTTASPTTTPTTTTSSTAAPTTTPTTTTTT